MISSLTVGLRQIGVHEIRSELAIGPPQKWPSAPPALRVMRWVIAAELALFVTVVIVSTVGRAVS